ncbi:MAG: hypothetical protein JWN40_1119 [Phycisphaerales bacterium]|nr:hypothetical protein [Phycisphaerales bacterium]
MRVMDQPTPQPPPPASQEERDHAIYASERKALGDCYRDGEKSIDTWLLTLSSGALGLSMTFVKEFAPQPKGVPWLIAAWGTFGISVFCVLSNLRNAPNVHLRFIQILDKYMQSNYYRSCYLDDVRAEQQRDPGLRQIDRLNRFAFWLFAVGLICLGVFLFMNLW